MLWLVQRLFYGPESALVVSKQPADVGVGRMAVLWPLAVLMLAMGVAPMGWLPTIENGVHFLQARSLWKGPVMTPGSVMPQAALPILLDGEGQR